MYHMMMQSNIASLITTSTNMKQLYFIGSPRTGSTLLGQIINYHPNCLISNESRFLQKVIEKGQDKISATQEMMIDACYQFNESLEKTDRFSKTIKTYQPKWQSFEQFKGNPLFDKKEILIIGDKKAGGNIHVYRNNKEKFNTFVAEEKPLFLMITRNPAETALSYLKSHGSGSYEEALRKVLIDTRDAYMFGINCGLKIVRYEELVNSTDNFLIDLFSFLSLETSKEWRKAISQIVSHEKVQVSNEMLTTTKNILSNEFHQIEFLFDVFND